MHLISIIFRFTIQLAVINTVLSVPSPHPSPTISPSPSLSKSDFDKTTVGKEQDASPPLEPPSQEGLESGRFNTPASRLSSLSSSGSQSADAVVASTFQPVWDASIYDLLPNSNGIGFNPSWTIDHVSVDFSKVIGQSSAGTKVFIGDSKTTPSIKVAVKVFNLEQVMQEKRTTSKEGTLQLLLKEGNILGIASHPNILKVSGLSLSLDGSRAFVFSEFCGRGDLVDLVQWSQRHLKNDRQEWKRRMHCVFWQLMHGLAHLHAENIHHSDIKPDNIFITTTGLVKIADFGFSQRVEKENDVALDESKTIGGTPPYISPDFLEALSSHKSFENASSVPFRKLYWYPMPSDVWAAGLTFLSSLTGLSPPWTTASFQDPHYLKFVQSNGHFFDRLQEAGLLDYYELRMINRMLDLNPAQRITAEDILNDPWFKTLDTTCSAYVAGKILTSE